MPITHTSSINQSAVFACNNHPAWLSPSPTTSGTTAAAAASPASCCCCRVGPRLGTLLRGDPWDSNNSKAVGRSVFHDKGSGFLTQLTEPGLVLTGC